MAHPANKHERLLIAKQKSAQRISGLDVDGQQDDWDWLEVRHRDTTVTKYNNRR